MMIGGLLSLGLGVGTALADVVEPVPTSSPSTPPQTPDREPAHATRESPGQLGSQPTGIDQPQPVGRARMVAQGSLEGRVTTPEGEPFAGAVVEIYDSRTEYWPLLDTTETGEDGGFQISIAPGTYALRFAPPAESGLAPQWWQAQSAGSYAKSVTVRAGDTVSKLDAQLLKAGTISGYVNNRGSTGMEHVDVVAYIAADNDFWMVDWATTDALGRYRLVLPPGVYTLLFQPPVDSTHIEQWWNKAADFEHATRFELKAGESLTRTANLITVGGMQGRVTGSDGSGIANVWADAYRYLDNGKISHVDSSLTDEDGYFRIVGLEPGWYYLYFDTQDAPGYASKWREHEYGGVSFIQVQDVIFTNLNDQLKALLKKTTPSISGTRAVGSTLTASTGAWTAGAKFSYQWYADGKAVAKATRSTFKLTKAQHGKKMTVKVTGKRTGYETASATSKPTAKVTLAATPKISGTAKVKSTLKVKRGTWTSKMKFSYRWYADGKPIPKATKASLKLGKSLKGKKITVTVTGKRSGFTTVTKTSTATKKVR